MATAPYGVRLLVGAATLAVEETIRLPKTILMYPMTLASTAAHVVMRFQQNVAELVIKGDATLEHIFPPKDEQPEWATFDEDLPGDDDEPADTASRGEGRFALYSSPGSDAAEDWARTAAKPTKQSVSAPDVVDELDYEQLTLAQLRARLQSLDVSELEALLAYEEATKGRAPFQTLLANRITRATAK
ncbi:lipid droplet-associated protein [Mycobacterium paraterrae]|uniref:Lipid droplet-associated protein n=1 Tax=Mycobacterium paraterrae TaxID=577492 RepID=A0ABY3VMY6_9MYCO|nr:lipid droplet-associated protein [Mycobacterium paraterrae]UMB70800.1 lipid droplet-associated protein [Mycobacterium paraterrae]